MTAGDRRSGFTLVELLVTIAVVVVLVTVAAPNFSSMVKSNRLAVASNDVLSSVLLARSKAVTEKADVSVNLGGSDGWPVTIVVDGQVFLSREKPSGSNVSIAWSSTPGVVFGPMGRASTSVSICISDSSELSKEIEISLAGQVKAYGQGVFSKCS